MQYCVTNKSQVALLVDFTDGSERLLQPGQYVLYNGPAEITRGARRELVDVGLVDVWEVNAVECLHDMSKVIDPIREPVQWLREGF